MCILDVVIYWFKLYSAPLSPSGVYIQFTFLLKIQKSTMIDGEASWNQSKINYKENYFLYKDNLKRKLV